MTRLAAPVVVVQFGIMLMGVVDAMMLGRVSKEALAAGGLGSSLSYGILGGLMGVLYALDPFVSQDYGAGRIGRVGLHLRRGLLLALVLAAVGSALLPLLAAQLEVFRQNEEIRPLVEIYLVALIPGVLPLLWFAALRQSLQAMSIVRPAVIAIVIGNLFNVAANYALVFGNLGFPKLGVLGSAYATSASRWVVLLALIAASFGMLRRLRLGRHTWAETVDLRAHLVLLRIGGPIAVHHSLEIWVFGAVGLMVGSMGALEFAGHQIAISLASLSFMVPMGIGGSATTRVGNAIGTGDKPGAVLSAKVALAIGGGVMAVSAASFALMPSLLARAFTPDLSVVLMAAVLLPIAAVFQLADGVQVVGAGILRGLADTAKPALYALIGFWGIGLPFGWWLAFPMGLGPAGLWWGLTAGLLGVAVLLVRRIRWMFQRPLEALQLAVEEEGEELEDEMDAVSSA